MIVVLDSNVWLTELALNSSGGSALRFYLKQKSARLAVPEVVRLEVQRKLRSRIEQHIKNLERGHRELLAIFRSMKAMLLPDEAEVESLISGIFENLGIDTLEVPFSFEAAKSSLLKVVNKLPPSSEASEEFIDGVLWANCMEMLEGDDVILATQDTDFFENRKYAEGPAQNLVDEMRTKPHTLHLVSSLAAVLEHVRSEVPLDEAWFASTVRARAHPDIDALLSKEGIGFAGEPVVERSLFITEDPEKLYFTYRLQLPCSDISGGGRTAMRLVIGGNGTLRVQPPEILDARPNEQTLTFVNADGTETRRATTFLSVQAAIGHATIDHTARHPLK